MLPKETPASPSMLASCDVQRLPEIGDWPAWCMGMLTDLAMRLEVDVEVLWALN